MAKLQKRAVRVEKQIKDGLSAQFHALPGRVGLKSIDHLIQALTPYSSAGSRATTSGSSAAPVAGAKRRGRPPGAGRRGRPPAAKRRGRPVGLGAAPSAATKAASKGKSSTRNRYSTAVKTAIRRDLEKGGKTFNQLSREYGPSVFSIKDWKKSWGLTKTRRKKAA